MKIPQILTLIHSYPFFEIFVGGTDKALIFVRQ